MFSRVDRPRVLLAAALVWMAIFATVTLLTEGHGSVGRCVVDVAYLLPHLLACVLALHARRRTAGAHRRLWSLLSLALPLWIAGESVVSLHHLRGVEPPFPGVADGFFIAFYIVLICTFLLGLRPALVIRSWRAIVDASVLAAAVGYVGWVALIAPQVSTPVSLATLVGIAYPLLDVVMLTILVSLALASSGRPPRSLLLLVGAIVAGALTDCALTFISLHTSAPELAWLKIGWESEALLLAGAAVAAAREATQPRRRTRPRVRDHSLTVVLGGATVTLAAVAAESLRQSPGTAGVLAALYVVLAIAVRLYTTAREREQIGVELEDSLCEQERLADTDHLTGLPNRRHADRDLREAIAHHAGGMPTLSVLVLDLDRFKDINDAHGHAGGDEVLRAAAARLTAVAREHDVVARYGGEEFVVIAHGVGPADLEGLAERYRQSIASRPVDLGGGRLVHLTTSVGGAAMPTDAHTGADLLRIADRALYAAKAAGRDRVRIGTAGAARHPDGDHERRDDGVREALRLLADAVDATGDRAARARDAARLAEAITAEFGVTPDPRVVGTALDALVPARAGSVR